MRESRFVIGVLVVGILVVLMGGRASADSPALPLKVGIIGIDAHARPWTKIINNPKAEGELADIKIVAAYPGGSPDIPQSIVLRKAAMKPMQDLGVEMVGSIDELLSKVDVVMVLSLDGRKHLSQAEQVFKSGKRVYIDKPIAATLVDAIRIFDMAEKYNVQCFTSSSLRYGPGTSGVRTDESIGEVFGCDTFSPCKTEPHHGDFFWYGIHGVEPLFTIMGTGCESVTRLHTERSDVAVGVWKGGRIGTFRGTRAGRHGYGSTVFGMKKTVQSGTFGGYEPLIVEIVKFFKTGKSPVCVEETLEIFAFMEAADESKRQGGRTVSIESVMEKAKKIARQK